MREALESQIRKGKNRQGLVFNSSDLENQESVLLFDLSKISALK